MQYNPGRISVAIFLYRGIIQHWFEIAGTCFAHICFDVLSHVINYQQFYYLSVICTMIYCSFNDMLNYSGVIILSCFSYFGLCCCPQRSESVCGHPPIPRSAPRVFQVTHTMTAWVPSASAHCWAPSQPSSSTPTQRPCWDAPYRPRGFRS